ncbi:unnamed protein product [Cuscuta epithymum]|uniref:Uncharacterized protein n=1 Tax=Cuscuta epithymum TaxID=186058 RepID=A0AAV0EQR3_9ASTE|nr:unnamed protein product [Cuscuta epithymum]
MSASPQRNLPVAAPSHRRTGQVTSPEECSGNLDGGSGGVLTWLWWRARQHRPCTEGAEGICRLEFTLKASTVLSWSDRHRSTKRAAGGSVVFFLFEL